MQLQKPRRLAASSHAAATPSGGVARPARLIAQQGRRTAPAANDAVDASTDTLYDAVIVGSGVGGLTTAARMAAKGAKVVVLEKYTIPGGSAAHYKRDGYTFDVGSSMMFGFGKKGSTNLITKCLESVGKSLETVPDPTQVHYHLPKSDKFPQGLNVQVWRDSQTFIDELSSRFPHEKEGIRAFYDEAWRVFNALNSIELKSLEEPRYLMKEFLRAPLACLTLATYIFSNTGEVARRHIKDPELLRFIDMECFTYSTVEANRTPMVTTGMVVSDRHYGGINYPLGGIGRIAETIAEGIEEHGGQLVYKANVKEIVLEKNSQGVSHASGVRLADGKVYRGKTIISNATRWDTFEKMIGDDRLPEGEQLFRKRYKKAPSFFSMHLGVKAEVLPKDIDCHHILLDNWETMQDARSTLFVSMPSLLDPSLAPSGRHIIHAFTPDWIDAWQGLSTEEYERKKEEVAEELCERLERLIPGLRQAITFKEIGTPRTHRRFLNRMDGTYGPIPTSAPWGIITMPLNTTDISGLYCVGDSTFPGQGVNAVVFSGFGCAHRALCDLGIEPKLPAALDDGWKAFLKWSRESALRGQGPHHQLAEQAGQAFKSAEQAVRAAVLEYKKQGGGGKLLRWLAGLFKVGRKASQAQAAVQVGGETVAQQAAASMQGQAVKLQASAQVADQVVVQEKRQVAKAESKVAPVQQETAKIEGEVATEKLVMASKAQSQREAATKRAPAEEAVAGDDVRSNILPGGKGFARSIVGSSPVSASPARSKSLAASSKGSKSSAVGNKSSSTKGSSNSYTKGGNSVSGSNIKGSKPIMGGNSSRQQGRQDR